MNQISLKANNETQCFASTSQPRRALNADYECASILHQTTTFIGNEGIRFDKQNFPKPLIGIEYVMEIIDSKFKEPYYICTLCDKTCDPRNILSQMTSHRHRLNYLELHFPTLMKKLYSTTKFKIDMAHRETVLTEIASKLESKFGRRQPKIIKFFDYDRNKKYFHDLVKDLPHYNENDFPSKDLLTNNFETFSDESSTDSEEVFKNYCEKKKKSENPHKFASLKTIKKQSEKKFKDAYIFQKYQSCLEIEIKKIETFYKPFERTPEDHPLYSSEWQTFWGKKYNELLKSNKDPNNYDYKPEWVKFWMPRMRELKIQKIEEKKSEICSKLNITNETMKKFDVDIAKKSSSPKRHLSSDSDSSSSSSDDEYYYRKCRDESKRQRRDYEVTDDSPVNIVTVCRLLTALESEIGIISPRVHQMLENAIEMERNEANSSEKMLKNLTNLNFLDTVKEKLKGMLVADLVGPSRMIPVKRAIKNIAILLHEAKNAQPDSVELAKQEIAKVLAQTLIDQGRTNVSPEELQDIVDEFLKSQMEETPKPSTSQSINEDKSEIENLTDEDIKTLLREFSDLTEEEQSHLQRFINKLEQTDPVRAKNLLKSFNSCDGC